MRPILLIAALAAAVTLPLHADLVLLDNGRYLKVETYRVDGAIVHLRTYEGGAIEIPLQRVERIIDDEVDYEIAPPAPRTDQLEKNWTFDRNQRPIFRSDYDDWIMQLAMESDVDAALVSAVIKAESDFNPVIVSHKGAQGLMQLMPATASRFGVRDAFDPVDNIRGGTKYLRVLLNMFDGNVELALAAYNAGEGNVRKYGGIPPFRETQNYVRKITGYLARSQGPAPAVLASSR